MTDTAPAKPAPKAKPASAKKAAKPKTPAAHPPTLQMVKAAIRASKDRKGTALPSIKKYIAANYKVDINRMAPYIRKAIKNACDKGALVRVGNKGHGASGSFKLASKKDDAEKPAKPKAARKPKSPAAKKPAAAAKKSPAKPKSPKKAAAKPKTPKKAAAKPKTPKKVAAKPGQRAPKSPAKPKAAAKKPAAKKPGKKPAAKK